MRNAIILHGKPSKKLFYDPNFPSSSNYYWIPWLQKQLAIRDIPTNTPEVPNSWVSDYSTWAKEFERYEVGAETILVGHSCGAGFILRWLSEYTDIQVGRVVLAAPWLDPDRLESTGDFFEFDLDETLPIRINGLRIIYSNNDEKSVLDTVSLLKQKLSDINYRELDGYGHFYDDRRMQFPELIEEILS